MDGDEIEVRRLRDEGRLHGGNLAPYVEEYGEHLGADFNWLSRGRRWTAYAQCSSCSTGGDFLAAAGRNGSVWFEGKHCRE